MFSGQEPQVHLAFLKVRCYEGSVFQILKKRFTIFIPSSASMLQISLLIILFTRFRCAENCTPHTPKMVMRGAIFSTPKSGKKYN